MGRGHTVCTFLRTVRRRSLHVCSGCGEARSIFPLYRIRTRALELRKWVSAVVVFTSPLDSYRVCFDGVERISTIIQMSLSLAFGRHFVTLLKPSIPCNDSPDRSRRHCSFRFRRCTDQNDEIDASRDKRVEHSRHRH